MMALLFVFLYEFAEVRQSWVGPSQRGKLQHVTLIEEAHRLLKATPAVSSSEIGDPRGKAVTMFTDMLAEMRAYGEGFIIADQSPTKLVSDTLKNTNLKIIHRLSHPDDRTAAGGCVNLTHEQMRHLNNLPPGQAVVHDERIGEAVLVQVLQFKDVAGSDEQLTSCKPCHPPVISNATYLYRHSGCRSCPETVRLLATRARLPIGRETPNLSRCVSGVHSLRGFRRGCHELAAPSQSHLRRSTNSDERGWAVVLCGVGTHGALVGRPHECRIGRWAPFSTGEVAPRSSIEKHWRAFARVDWVRRSVGRLPWGLHSVEAMFAGCTERQPLNDNAKRDCPGCSGDCVTFRFVSPRLKDLEKLFVNRLLGSLKTNTDELLNSLYILALPSIPLLSRHTKNQESRIR